MDENEELGALLHQAKGGDAGAREALLGRIRDRARRYALFALVGQLGARLDASDVAQDVCLRIHKQFDPNAFPDAPRLLAWLNVVIRRFVGEIRAHHHAALRNAGREVAGGELFPGLSTESTGPEGRAARRELAERLTAAVAGLRAPLRDIVRLNILEGRPFAEAGEIMGVTEGHARVLLCRALKQLREQQGEQT